MTRWQVALALGATALGGPSCGTKYRLVNGVATPCGAAAPAAKAQTAPVSSAAPSPADSASRPADTPDPALASSNPPATATATAAWRGPTRTARELADAIAAVSAGRQTSKAFVMWLGLDGASNATLESSSVIQDGEDEEGTSAESMEQNLDADPDQEMVITVTANYGNEFPSLYVVMDAQGDGYAAAGSVERSEPRGICAMEILPLHDGRFSDLWIACEGSVSQGMANQLTMSSATVHTLESGSLVPLFEDGDSGLNQADEFRVAIQPANPPRAIERVRDDRIKQRYVWNGQAFK
ncbi:MAG TPA: hypothetical protein PLU22_01860 [Polyangiaceae bacterium]|nr:hypothetical protein [Polyangiaceae bacterium]